MIDLYLRADTEAELAAALPFGRQDDAWISATHDYALDLIGPIVTTEGAYDEDGGELTPPVIDIRFHANMRCTERVAAIVPTSLQVSPNSPSRVWA